MIPTGRLEQLPPQSLVDELYVCCQALVARRTVCAWIDSVGSRTSIYFSKRHSEAPMQDPTRYLASLHRPPHMQPPICLQYAILAMAASQSPTHKELALPFYQRARNYIEHDEMRVGTYFAAQY